MPTTIDVSKEQESAPVPPPLLAIRPEISVEFLQRCGALLHRFVQFPQKAPWKGIGRPVTLREYLMGSILKIRDKNGRLCNVLLNHA
ncbi:MAG: hypothetical protein WCC25_17930, partial [Candidatus Korobacteraceae bacterium]